MQATTIAVERKFGLPNYSSVSYRVEGIIAAGETLEAALAQADGSLIKYFSEHAADGFVAPQAPQQVQAPPKPAQAPQVAPAPKQKLPAEMANEAQARKEAAAAAPAPVVKPRTVLEMKALIPEKIRPAVDVQLDPNGEWLMVIPHERLGPDRFQAMYKLCKDLGGDFLNPQPDSQLPAHFSIPVAKP